ncbi:phytoene desaturase [Magnetospirillum fulvum]|uniref:Phytoene dehydrogenase n=1 Tax=Magnetospirillum fulvum TaxID=1082 RepID=A0A1H6HJS8_MAGFU|nr:phytoene desaturase [Magnetospirillum fulvum]SEH34350.1 phytoene desaturase [Magnetospirillum fulvum]
MTLAHSQNTIRDGATRPHAVVIGSGYGGLAAAIRLGARGYRVTVLERLDAAGGRGYVFRQDGFTFDAGPTIITAPFLFEELWKLCGKTMSDDIDLRLMDPFYRIRFDDGRTFDYCGDRDRLRAEVAKFCPGDLPGYDRFMKASEGVFRVGFEKLSSMPFSSITDMLKVAPAMAIHRSYRSVYQFAAEYLSDDALRIVFSFHPLLIGGNPYSVTSVYSLISYLEQRWGVHFAMGGTGALVQGLVGLIEGQGNKIRYKSPVARILAEQGRAVGVRLESGEVIDADIVVSNADAATTYNTLLADEPRFRWSDSRIEKSVSSMSAFVWYFGTRKRYEDVPHHTILLGPRYRGLLHDIFDKKTLAEDFSLYLYRPTATDPSMAPKGCDSFYVLSPVPNLEGDTDWTTEAEIYRKRIAAYLSRTVLPDLEANVVSSRMTTPLDFQNRLQSFRGAAFGMQPILLQSAWFRPNNRSEELDRLYLVGAGTHPGAGLPGVLSSAQVIDRLVPDANALI